MQIVFNSKGSNSHDSHHTQPRHTTLAFYFLIFVILLHSFFITTRLSFSLDYRYSIHKTKRTEQVVEGVEEREQERYGVENYLIREQSSSGCHLSFFFIFFLIVKHYQVTAWLRSLPSSEASSSHPTIPSYLNYLYKCFLHSTRPSIPSPTIPTLSSPVFYTLINTKKKFPILSSLLKKFASRLFSILPFNFNFRN